MNIHLLQEIEFLLGMLIGMLLCVIIFVIMAVIAYKQKNKCTWFDALFRV